MITQDNKYVGLTIKISNIFFFLTMLGSMGISIYFLTQLPFTDRSFKDFSESLGTIGMIISFFPLAGLVFKYTIKLLKRWEYKTGVAVFIASLSLFLFWERKTRLLMAWTAIFLIIAHMIVFASLIDSHQYIGKHAEKYTWNFAIIAGFMALGLIILMNLNGIVMLVMKKKKFHLNKIKYLGMFNLVCGISFLVFTIIHIAMIG